jgi:hypothetical protein
MTAECTIDWTLERDDGTIDVTILGRVSPFVRGRTHGLPENCYPDDLGEVEIVEVFDARDVPWAGELTSAEREVIEEALSEAAADSYDGPEWDDDL